MRKITHHLFSIGLLLGASLFSMTGLAQNIKDDGYKSGYYLGFGAGYGGTYLNRLTGSDIVSYQHGFLSDLSAASGNYRGNSLGLSQNFMAFTWRANTGYLFLISQRVVLGAEWGYTGYLGSHYTFNNSLIDAAGNRVSNLVDSRRFTEQYVDLLAVFKYYLSDGFNFLFKVGPAFVHQKYIQSYTHSDLGIDGFNQGQKDRVAKDVTHFELAAGFEYMFDFNLGFNVIYSYVVGDGSASYDTTTIVPSIYGILGGVTYHFEF